MNMRNLLQFVFSVLDIVELQAFEAYVMAGSMAYF